MVATWTVRSIELEQTKVEDQQRVIGYIKLADVDGSGTIDFLEFLQLLRLVMECDTLCGIYRHVRSCTGIPVTQILKGPFSAFSTLNFPTNVSFVNIL